MTQVFPFNYFATIFSFVKSFTNRNYLKIWQMVIVVFLLNSMLLFPLSLQIGRMTAASLADFVPEAMSMIDDNLILALNKLEGNAEHLGIRDFQLIKEDGEKVVAFAPDADQARALLDNKVGLVFTPDAFHISEEGAPVIEQVYTGEIALNQVDQGDELAQIMSQQWFGSNRSSIVLTNFIYIWLLVFTSILILIFGTSFFLSLMKYNQRMYSIRSFREAFTITLNCLGLPTILAMFVGLITGNPVHLLTAQAILAVMMLITVYWKTHFNDQYVSKKLKSEIKSSKVKE